MPVSSMYKSSVLIYEMMTSADATMSQFNARQKEERLAVSTYHQLPVANYYLPAGAFFSARHA